MKIPTPAPFGATGLTVTPIGLGLAALGRPSYINLGRADDLPADRDKAAMEARCHDVLDAAYTAGVRYFDAARSYGLAEQFLGHWLDARGRRPADLTVGSKWGYTYTANWQAGASVHETKDLSARTLERQIHESREHLGAFLGLYQIHSATLESGVLDDARVLAALDRLRQDGLVIGLSVSGPRQAETIRRAFDAGVFSCVQATWNLFEPSGGAALAEAHARGWGVIVKESLANGRLTARGAPQDVSILRAIAAELGEPLDAVAIAAALAQPWVHVVLSGAATPAHLSSNLRALEITLTRAQLDALGGMAEPSLEYWERRSRLPWT